ncbi:hypothetical protein L6452_00583 [Arctium lappa]|uniref:Uncharacterized protein n=1 Tax=Arctium lappa TaxID=4217 RepID=A0ACB9FF45_ARCLA|nr:hypothetical protein L6452_00583 [Arctium lappa]
MDETKVEREIDKEQKLEIEIDREQRDICEIGLRAIAGQQPSWKEEIAGQQPVVGGEMKGKCGRIALLNHFALP